MGCVRGRKRAVLGGLLSFAIISGGAILAQEPPRKENTCLPRAYEGAPPLIPHEVEARKGMCLDCHGTGLDGAPLTPHPTRAHYCLQCHVGQDLTVEPFVMEKARVGGSGQQGGRRK